MRRIIAAILAALSVQSAYAGEEAAFSAAAADSFSTYLAVSRGAIEMNPLVSTNPAGLLVLFAAKSGLILTANATPEAVTANRVLTTAWGAASCNNLALALGAGGPVGWAAAIISGIILWSRK